MVVSVRRAVTPWPLAADRRIRVPYRGRAPETDQDVADTSTPTRRADDDAGVDVPAAPAAQRSRADELARRILRIEDEVPGAVFPMRGSLMLSAIRCLVTYVAIPLLVPVFGWLTPIAAPLSLLLTVVAAAMAITSLRRVWAAEWSGRWAYTAFAVVVLLALAGLLVVDVLTLLG